MRWVTNKEQNDYMKMRQAQNRAKGMTQAELWAYQKLKLSPLKWKTQAVWGCRLFDFWCGLKGCAIEMDGPEHDPVYDSFRDNYNKIRSFIEVFRVPNFNAGALDEAIKKAVALPDWKDRKVVLTKRERREKLKSLGIPLAHGDWRPPQQ
jgi:very-short-patch-repair endonuclease